MSEQHFTEGGLPPHRCDTGHFDRTICPEPCGYMHSYCATCGKRQDPCAYDATPAEHDGHAARLNGLLADCAGCVIPRLAAP